MIKKTLGVRLPIDHWIWLEPNKREVIEKALRQYRELSSEMGQIRKTVEEIRSKLAEQRDLSVQVVQTEAGRKEFKQEEEGKTSEIDPVKFLGAITSAFEV